MRSLKFALICAAGTMALAHGAKAQGAGEAVVIADIVVTANKREQTLLSIPESVATLDEARLNLLGVKDVQDYAAYVPGLQITAPVPGTTKTTIRGLSSESVTSTVGVYIDETPVTQNELDPDLKLFDVARIEVLRGPQGTLYGEGSLGGTIRIITNKPDPARYQGGVEATVSSFENGDGANGSLAGFVNLPLVADKLALRAVVSYRDNAGWIDNLGPGDSSNDEKALTGRVALRWLVNEDLTASLTYIGQKIELGSPRALVDPALGDLKRFTRVNESNDDEMHVGSLTFDWDLGFATLTSDSSYYWRRQNTVGNNNSLGGVTFFYNLFDTRSGGAPGAISVPEAVVDFTGRAKQFTQEVRLVSPTGSRFDWIVGAFYKDRSDQKYTDYSGLVEGRPTFNFNIRNARNYTTINMDFKQIAFFGEGTWHISDAWDLTAGLRYSREKVGNSEFNDGLFYWDFASLPPLTRPAAFGPVSKTFHATTPRVVLSYSPTDTWLLYGSVSKGFRSGGFVGVTPFSPDTVWSYELGGKGSFHDGRGTFAAAVYRVDWEDVQAFDDLPNPPFFAVRNLGTAKVTGAEFEVTYAPVESLQLAAGLSLTDTKITALASSATANAELKVGNRLQKVPNYQYNASATYVWPVMSNGWNAIASVNIAGRGSSFSTYANRADGKLKSWAQLGARIGVESKTYGVYLFGKNLTDERIPLDIQTPASGGSLFGTQVARPRLIGVEVTAKWN